MKIKNQFFPCVSCNVLKITKFPQGKLKKKRIRKENSIEIKEAAIKKEEETLIQIM